MLCNFFQDVIDRLILRFQFQIRRIRCPVSMCLLLILTCESRRFVISGLVMVRPITSEIFHEEILNVQFSPSSKD